MKLYNSKSEKWSEYIPGGIVSDNSNTTFTSSHASKEEAERVKLLSKKQLGNRRCQ